MRAVITAVGKDMVGILAKVANECAKVNANIIDVTQSVLNDTFTMTMIVDISKLNCPLTELSDNLAHLSTGLGISTHVMHEDIFNSMHRI